MCARTWKPVISPGLVWWCHHLNPFWAELDFHTLLMTAGRKLGQTEQPRTTTTAPVTGWGGGWAQHDDFSHMHPTDPVPMEPPWLHPLRALAGGGETSTSTGKWRPLKSWLYFQTLQPLCITVISISGLYKGMDALPSFFFSSNWNKPWLWFGDAAFYCSFSVANQEEIELLVFSETFKEENSATPHMVMVVLDDFYY